MWEINVLKLPIILSCQINTTDFGKFELGLPQGVYFFVRTRLNLIINCISWREFWTRARSKYTDLGEFETIWLHKTIRLYLG